jgi:DNA invertase Pin-like site-specific DNA recombinase
LKVRIALYARVSTEDQTVDQQLDDLRRVCARQDWHVTAELTDVISGSKFTRQGLDKLMGMVRHRKIDLIVCHKLDRLGRSLQHLAQMIGEFDSNGVALFIPGQGIDTRIVNPAGKLQMNILMAVAEFERSLISERTKVKLQALKRAGKHIGRPKMHDNVRKSALALFQRVYGQTGKAPTCRAMAQELGMSIGTAHRLRAEISKTANSASISPFYAAK